MVIYLLGGVGGNLFSSLMDWNLSVGASTSIFGLLGAMAGFLLLNWNKLGEA